jgi:uncharacterized membrane protein HdeD (DUF308 family)
MITFLFAPTVILLLVLGSPDVRQFTTIILWILFAIGMASLLCTKYKVIHRPKIESTYIAAGKLGIIAALVFAGNPVLAVAILIMNFSAYVLREAAIKEEAKNG